jgi:uncharacterized protein (TIGR02246 family)
MNRLHHAAALTVLVLGVLGLAPAQAPDEAAIRARVKEYVAAYNRGDAKAVAANYAQDGTHTYALGFTHRGRVEIEKGLADLLAGPWKGTQIAITPERIRLLGGAVAVEEATFVLSGLKMPSGSPVGDVKGVCLGVYQKQGQQWLAAAVQCMVPPPPPGA